MGYLRIKIYFFRLVHEVLFVDQQIRIYAEHETKLNTYQ